MKRHLNQKGSADDRHWRGLVFLCHTDPIVAELFHEAEQLHLRLLGTRPWWMEPDSDGVRRPSCAWSRHKAFCGEAASAPWVASWWLARVAFGDFGVDQATACEAGVLLAALADHVPEDDPALDFFVDALLGKEPRRLDERSVCLEVVQRWPFAGQRRYFPQKATQALCRALEHHIDQGMPITPAVAIPLRDGAVSEPLFTQAIGVLRAHTITLLEKLEAQDMEHHGPTHDRFLLDRSRALRSAS